MKKNPRISIIVVAVSLFLEFQGPQEVWPYAHILASFCDQLCQKTFGREIQFGQVFFPSCANVFFSNSCHTFKQVPKTGWLQQYSNDQSFPFSHFCCGLAQYSYFGYGGDYTLQLYMDLQIISIYASSSAESLHLTCQKPSQQPLPFLIFKQDKIQRNLRKKRRVKWFSQFLNLCEFLMFLKGSPQKKIFYLSSIFYIQTRECFFCQNLRKLFDNRIFKTVNYTISMFQQRQKIFLIFFQYHRQLKFNSRNMFFLFLLFSLQTNDLVNQATNLLFDIIYQIQAIFYNPSYTFHQRSIFYFPLFFTKNFIFLQVLLYKVSIFD